MGVSRGSVLGPKIFINYAEDVSEIFSQHDLSHHQFVDDMQCLCYGKPGEVPYMPWSRLLKTVICCAAKRLQLNADKTEILWFRSAANLRKLSTDELKIRAGQSIVKPVAVWSRTSPEYWCSDRRSVIGARPHLATGAGVLLSLTPSTLSASSARPRRHETIGLRSRTVTPRLL